jgi:HPt (histidine-containing phosphotransfer) domain-containing protein
VFRLAHTMKGEALAWGATDLVETSRVIEEQAQIGRLDGLARPMDELAAVFEQTVAALDGLRPKAA